MLTYFTVPLILSVAPALFVLLVIVTSKFILSKMQDTYEAKTRVGACHTFLVATNISCTAWLLLIWEKKLEG